MNAVAKRETGNTGGSVITEAKSFRNSCTQIASSLLRDWVGQERAMEAVGRVSSALASAAASAKKPEEFYSCTVQSIGAVIAISALTGIMPSTGANALAYAIPRRARKGEAPQLQYQLSHRGLAALARRSGQTLVAVPIGFDDVIRVDSGGGVVIVSMDIDNPPVTFEELRGVIIIVKETATGMVNFSGWMPSKLIKARRDASDAYTFAAKPGNEWAKKSDPWHKWPVEQSMKTAMHYATSRGWCVIDDTESVRALASDSENLQTIDAVSSRPMLPAGTSQLDALTRQLTGSPEEDTEVVPESGDEVTQQDEKPATGRTNAAKTYEARLISAKDHGELLTIGGEMDGDEELSPSEAKALGKLLNELAKDALDAK